MIGIFKRNSDIKKPSETINLKDPGHQWIRDDQYLLRFFTHFVSLISIEDKESLSTYGEIIFIPSQGMFSSVIPSHADKTFVLVYPELYQMIKAADNEMAYAILFHELGHLYYRHFTFRSDLDEMTKQIEADEFAIKYGFSKALFQFLSSMPITEETSRRLEMIRLRA